MLQSYTDKMTSKTEILAGLSAGEIGLMVATEMLGFQDAGYTLQALHAAGMRPFALDEATIRKQAEEGLDALRAALKLPRSTIH